MVFFQKRTSSTRHKGKRSRLKVFFLWFVCVSLIIGVFVGVWHGTRLEAVTLVSVAVEGGKTIDHEIIRERALDELEGDYLLLVPKRFSFLYPKKEIISRISSIPRIKDVEVELLSRKKLRVRFDEYIPEALWCKELTNVEADNCFFIDKDGYAFTPAPILSGTSISRYVNQNADPEIGRYVFPSEVLFRSEDFRDALEKDRQFRIFGVTLTKDSDIVYHLAGGGEIRTPHNEDIQDVFDSLISILDSEEFAHLAPGNFEYIDLRFGDKVFVREESVREVSETEEEENEEVAEVEEVEEVFEDIN